MEVKRILLSKNGKEVTPVRPKKIPLTKHVSEIFVYVNQIGVARNDVGIGNQNEEQQTG